MASFQEIIEYLQELDSQPEYVSVEDQLLVINNDSRALKNLVIKRESPILVIEQVIMRNAPNMDKAAYFRLLQINRSLVHGAFVIDDAGEYIIFRDTLQVENLDCNELEGSINSLSLALAEFSEELIEMFHRQ